MDTTITRHFQSRSACCCVADSFGSQGADACETLVDGVSGATDLRRVITEEAIAGDCDGEVDQLLVGVRYMRKQ